MPNLISVTSHGTPQDILRGKDILTSGALAGALGNTAPEPVKRFAGDAMQALRGVKAVTSANPIGYAVNELFFPQPVADGTLKGKPGFE